jgi:predicted metal-dependent hydrolase
LRLNDPDVHHLMLKSIFGRKPKRAAGKKRDKRELLAIEGEKVAVHVRFHLRARRMVIRVHPVSGDVTLTAPKRASMASALAFAARESEWIAHQRGAMPKQVTFAAGADVPFLGTAHRIIHAGSKGPAPVWCQGGEIFVSGQAEHARRRLTDYFKREAKKLLEARALEYGTRLGVRPSRVTVRDTASRWGSCSSARSLSFSWRLIFAPEFVRDYVVAHEVAHLKEMNHGPQFWAHVASLGGDTKRARRWLREHGRGLLRYN